MTAPTHAHTAMSPPPDTPQHSLSEHGATREPDPSGAAAESRTVQSATPIGGTGTRIWAAVGLTVIPGVLSAALVALMIFAFTSVDNRITSLENRLTAFENRVDAKFATQDAKINEINLKLTALIAALDKTDEVDAALTGEIATP
ncbi:MAG: hypothetical protein OXH54_04080 [Acidimicrobiaceae bacterium]|nr:hypothetical protein [Acidimicrobiaceae bacterium]MDE0493091.1 hypothetical protein [Acidimicrobiaceae bacterium]